MWRDARAAGPEGNPKAQKSVMIYFFSSISPSPEFLDMLEFFPTKEAAIWSCKMFIVLVRCF
jgi:hypothetical protein